MNTVLLETGVATATTAIVATSIDASPLLTALIGFGVSVVTIVGSELIKFLVAYFKKKTSELKIDEGNDEEKKEGK